MVEETFENWVKLVRIFLKRSPLLRRTRGAAHAMALVAEHDEDFYGLQTVLTHFSKKEQWAWDAVAAMAESALRRPWVTLTDELAHWTADVVAGKLPRPKTGKKKFAQRDLIIAEAIYLLTVLRPMKPTRRLEQNRRRITECCAEGGSACDAVGVAMGMNYKTVERIWGEWGPYAIKRLEPKDGQSAMRTWLSPVTLEKFEIKSDQT